MPCPNSHRQGRISVSYLLPAVSETQEQLTLRIIGMLLVDGPSSPFFKSLVESGLGADFSPNTGWGLFPLSLSHCLSPCLATSQWTALPATPWACDLPFPGRRSMHDVAARWSGHLVAKPRDPVAKPRALPGTRVLPPRSLFGMRGFCQGG